MFCEDDDLFLRLNLMAMNIHIALDALCYHFVSKTSRFSEEYKNKTKRIEANSIRNYIRKWRFSNSSALQKSYDIGFVLSHANMELLSLIEPWCSCIYTDFDPSAYIAQQQPLTAIDLKSKIRPVAEQRPHDVIIKADGNRIKGRILDKIKRLNEVVHKIAIRPPKLLDRILGKRYAFGILKIFIYKNVGHELELINRVRNENYTF